MAVELVHEAKGAVGIDSVLFCVPFELNGKNCIQSSILKQMPFIIFLTDDFLFVNNEHDQFYPEFFLYVSNIQNLVANVL